jgi:DNA-binding MarR family transcriptional regulator/GNAT superfamily N-acetyltransferase
MDREQIASVRQFNRTVTQHIGALDEAYLERDRPLGASRLLWEVGAEGADTRALRSRLDLDSGYLSRLLRILEAQDLITVGADPNDGRVRVVHLTSSGRAERAVLDERSDDLAWSLLEPLDASRRDALVEAMQTVDRLLTAASVRIEVEPPTSDDATWCIRSYFAEIDSRFDTGFDPEHALAFDLGELVEPAGALLLARLHGEPVACGAIKFHAGQPGEIKRMWVAERARGLGVGRRMLASLEAQALAHGATAVHLETNRSLGEAIAMYRSSGYVEVPPFNDEPYAHHWFHKELGSG